MFTEIKNEMNSTKQKLTAIATATPTTNVTEYTDIMNKIAAINHAYLILNSETNSKPKKEYQPRVANKTAIINGVEKTVSTKKDALTLACKDIVKNHYQTLKANNDKLVSSSTGKHFASIHKEDIDCTEPVEIKNGRKTFYYDPQKMATNNSMLFKKMLNTINLPENYLEYNPKSNNTQEA